MNDSDKSEHEPQVAEPEAMLTAVEARVLGALMEKQLTTPDAYPLTVNSLVLACNQKTSRDPVTNLTDGEVQHSLSQMQDRKLVEVEYGSRANRYDQRLTRVLGLDKSVQAVLNVMLLRGPQTASELLTRTQRMYNFGSAAQIEELLTSLCQKTTPVVQHIPRQAGQREDRYVHLLCGKPDMTALSAKSSPSSSTTTASTASFAELTERVAVLEKQVAKLMELNGLVADAPNTL